MGCVDRTQFQGCSCAFGLLLPVNCAIRRNARSFSLLRWKGDLVLATFDKVERDTDTTFNNRHPWRVHAHWVDPADAKQYLFTSEMLWKDPAERMGQAPLRIDMERGNSKHDAMDLS